MKTYDLDSAITANPSSSHSSFLCMVYPATCPLRALVLPTPADLHASSDRWIQDTYAAKMSRIQTRITNLHKSEKSDKRLLLAAGDSLKTDHFPQDMPGFPYA